VKDRQKTDRRRLNKHRQQILLGTTLHDWSRVMAHDINCCGRHYYHYLVAVKFCAGSWSKTSLVVLHQRNSLVRFIAMQDSTIASPFTDVHVEPSLLAMDD